MAKMPAIFVVINRVDETVFPPVECFSLLGKEKLTARTRTQRLPAKRGLLIKAEPTVEAGKCIVGIYKAPVGSQETDERIRFTDVTLEAEYANGSILIQETGISGRTLILVEVARTVSRCVSV